MHMSRRAVCGAGAAVMAGGTGEAAASAWAAPTPAAAERWPLVELRRYRTRPGRRDELIELFERAFVETQEQAGMRIIGTFREPDRPDAFTWLRGFPDMPARARALNDFYFGPVWQANREAANACIDDSDDVLLMREAWPGSAFPPDRSPRRAPGEGPPDGPGRILARQCWPADPPAFAAWARAHLPELLSSGSGRLNAAFVRERSPNNFPRLPVREGEDFFVWFERYAEAQPLRPAPDLPGLKRPVETLVLRPTRRSRLHG